MSYKDAFIQVHYHLCHRILVYESWAKNPDRHKVRKGDADLMIFTLNSVLNDLEKIEKWVKQETKLELVK